MNTGRALLVFIFSAGALIAAAQTIDNSKLLLPRATFEARLVNAARLAYLQQAEPNPQNPTTPQANTSESKGGPPSQSTAANTAGSSTGTLAPPPDDPAALQSRIQEALRNEPTLGSSHVAATVTERTIELSGTVASSQDKLTAERIAASFDGNRQITDKLVVTGGGVTPSATRPAQR